MTPKLPLLLTSWDLRLEIILVLATAGSLFIAGWMRVRGRGGRRLATGWRLGCYLAGLAVLALALMSVIDLLGQSLFLMHMIQHLLIVMIAAPLLLLANPFPFTIWGLPNGPNIARLLFSQDSRFRRALIRVTRPGILWLTFVTILWGWHDPAAYNAALRIGWLHDLQHLTFFGAAMLFWWRLVNAGPRTCGGRFPLLARLGFLLAGAAANMIPGVVIALAEAPLYAYYVDVPRVWGLTVIQDQVLAGIIMWIPGTMMYFLAALVILFRALGRPESKAFGFRRVMQVEPAPP